MSKLISIMFLIALYVSTASLSSAEVYKWTNDDGSIGITNDLTRVPNKYKDKAEIIDFQSDAIDKERVYEEVIIPDDSLSKDLTGKIVPRGRDIDDKYNRRLLRREREYQDEDGRKRKRRGGNRKFNDEDTEEEDDEEEDDEEGEKQ